jgi:hypothetical protein
MTVYWIINLVITGLIVSAVAQEFIFELLAIPVLIVSAIIDWLRDRT